MIGRIIDFVVCYNRKQRLTLELSGDFTGKYDNLKDKELDVDIKQHREKRSLNANAYFHVLVNKIAAATNDSDDKVKQRLVVEYGTLETDDDGMTVGFKLPASVDVDKIYKYTRCFDTRYENGKEFRCYLVYKRTHNMNSKEIARVIDGAIEAAQELGIETDTPEQLEKYKKMWEEEEKSGKR